MEAKLKIWELKISDYLLIAWGFFFALFVSSKLLPLFPEYFGDTSFATLLSTISFQLCLLVYAIIVNMAFKFGLFSPRLSFLPLLKKSLKYFCLALAIVFLTNLTINIIALLLGYSFELQAAIELWHSLDGYLEIALGAIATVILAPLGEELVFRGLLYRLLRGKLPLYLAAIASSLVFALIHFSVFAFLSLFFLSCLLCYIYEKFGDLRLCILVHCTFNLFNTILILLCQSGQNL